MGKVPEHLSDVPQITLQMYHRTPFRCTTEHPSETPLRNTTETPWEVPHWEVPHKHPWEVPQNTLQKYHRNTLEYHTNTLQKHPWEQTEGYLSQFTLQTTTENTTEKPFSVKGVSVVYSVVFSRVNWWKFLVSCMTWVVTYLLDFVILVAILFICTVIGEPS
jgi:hypothetical protein